MALPNNPTPNELVKAVKDVENNLPLKQDKFTELSTDSNLWELTTGIYIATNDIFLRVKQAFYGVGLPSGTIMQVNGDIDNQYGLTATYVANNQVFVAQSYYTSENVIDGDFKILGLYDTTPTENSQNPVTSGGIFNALANKEDVAYYDTGKRSWYVRFYSGLQICWGYENSLANNSPVTFPKPFTTARVMITQRGITSTWNDNMKVNGDETTGFTVNSGGTTNIDWIAVGLWDVNGG